MRKLPDADMQALAALVDADTKLTDLEAAGVHEDDPRYMEAVAGWQECQAVVAPGPDSPAFLMVRKGEAVSACATEPEAN